MNEPPTLSRWLPCLIIVALGARTASATTVQDLVWLKGHEPAEVTGMGIVVGLNGTGDRSNNSLVAARPYAKLMSNLGNPVVNVEELAGADAYAIVSVSMRIDAAGARDGDRFDVSVEKAFNAESLEGGRLVVSLLRLPGPDSPESTPIAFASGPLVVDPDNPGSAIIRNGGQMLIDLRNDPVRADGTMTLVLKKQYAGYPVAATIAGVIDDEFGIDGLTDIAEVEDAKNIRIFVPRADRARPALFIATLMTIPIDPSLIQAGARIVINERAGIITVTGDVEIGPVAITHRGMQLSSFAPDAGAAAAGPGGPGGGPAGNPVAGGDGTQPLIPRRWIGFDTSGAGGRSATRLADLLAAFDQLAVPTDDQIAIVYELEKTGALHAEIVNQ